MHLDISSHFLLIYLISYFPAKDSPLFSIKAFVGLALYEFINSKM